VDNLTYYLEILKLEPENISALKGLTEIYKAQEQWDKLIEMYEKLFSLSQDDDERINYIIEAADTYYYKLTDMNKSMEFYLDALELNPFEENVVGKVKEILEKSKDMSGLNILLEGECLLSKDAERVYETTNMLVNNYVLLGRYDEALSLLSRLTSPPYQTAKQLYDKLLENNLLSRIVEYKDLFINVFTSHEELANLYNSLAGIYEETLNDLYETAYNYEMALTSDAANQQQIVQKLSRIYTSLDEPVLLLSILLKMKDNATPEETFESDKSIGLCYLRLEDTVSALPFLKNALSEKSDDKSLLYTTLDVYTQLGTSEDITGTLKKLIDVEDDNDKRTILLKRAIPLFMETRDYDTAKQLIPALVDITGDQSNYQLLEQIYRDTEDYNSLVTFYLERLNGKEDQKDSAPLWASLGEAYLKGFSHYEYALDSYTRASTLDPDNMFYREKLATLYSSSEKWPEAEQALLKLLPSVTDGNKKLSFQLALGDIYLSRIINYDNAIGLYHEILSSDPQNETAISALERIYRETGNYTELAAILEMKLPVAESKYDILAELGSLLFDRGIDIKKAQEYLWQALESNPQASYVIDVLKRLYETTGDSTGFEKLYSFLIDKTNASQETKTELLLKLAHIRNEKLAVPERAIATFEQVLLLEPGNNDANVSLAILYFNAGIWEKAEPHFSFSVNHNSVEPEQFPEFLFKYARTLDKLARQQDSLQFYKKAFELNGNEKRYAEAYGYSACTNHDYEAIINAFETLLKISANIDDVHDIYKKLASAYEEKKDYRAASIYLMKLTEHEPSNREYFKWLERLCADGKDYTLLASVLKKEAELSTSDEDIIAMSLRRASIQEENLGDPKSAVKTLEELIKSGKQNVEIYMKLASLYKKLNNTQDLMLTIRETLKFEISGDQKVDLLLELAELSTDDKEKAIAIYKDVLVLEPENNTAFSSLSKMYETGNDYNALSVIYDDRLSHLQPSEEKIELQKRLAVIKAENLNDAKGAIALYQDILNFKSSDIGTYQALESLLLQQGEFRSLNELYKNAAKNIEKREIKLDYLTKSAELLVNMLKDEKGAIQSYEAVLGIDKTNSDILIKTARLAVSQQMYDKAMTFYKETVALTGIPDETRAEINFEYGKVLKGRAPENDVYQAYKAAYNLNPSNIDYRLAYGESAYAVGLYKDAHDALKNITYAHEHELSPEQLFPLYKILSDISKRLGNIQQAVEYLLRAVDINNKDMESLLTLDELTSTLGNYELEIEVLMKLSALIPKPVDRAQVLIKVAKLKHDKTYDLNGAIPLLREAMTIMPDNTQICNELIQIYREQSNIDNEIEILLKLLKIEKDSVHFVAAAMRLGDIYIEFKNDTDTAKKYYLEALKKEPSSIPVLRGLGKIFELQGNLAGKADLYQKFIKILLPKEPKSILPLIKELAELYATKMNNNELAIQQYQTVLNVEPSDVHAHCSLAELFSKNKTMISDAVREYGIVLKYTPGNIHAIRFLAKFYELKKDYDRVFLYWSTLKLLGEEKDLERIFVEANKNKQPRQPKLPITDDLFLSHIMHIKTRGPLKDILNAFPDYGGSIFKPDVKLYGAGKHERITTKSTSWQEYGPLLQLLGIKDIDIYQTTKGNFKLIIENTDPPSLILNIPSLSDFSAQERSFIITEYLTYIRSGFVLPIKLGKQKFALFIHALIKILSPATPTPDDKDPNLQTVSNALNSVLTKKQRTALDEPIKKYLKMPDNYLDEWFKGIEMTGARTGAFIVGDTEPVFSSLVKWHIGDASLLSNKEKRKDIFTSSELMQDILQFYLSDGHFLLRNKLGMSILSV
jgi:tetratricopeptide (TPR) repeat protein